ncbi:MAG: hypothetical protein ABW148_01650 [Sedimenticola sp.]
MNSDNINLNLGEKWISILWRRLSSIRKKRASVLNEINDSILYSDPTELAKVYVEPFCQEVNPADRHDEDFFTSREPLFRKVSEFLRLKTYQKGNNQLFILSDSGMGKTSFLVMLKLLHLTSFWPKSYDCVLLKLGESTITDICNIENRRKTLLLLDSLDEDPLAYGRSKERLLDILKATHMFNRVIITCRTQFFPTVDNDPLEYPGRIRIGGFICPSKYLSLFDDNQVENYLNKRFPKKLFRSNEEEIKKSHNIINRMASLRCRPMLLSFIEDLVNLPGFTEYGVGSEYLIYNSLVQSWLIREGSKTGHSSQVLLKACAELAFKMQSKKKIKITPHELDELISELEYLGPLKKIDITGRSLINKNSAGEFRFSHYSIQEFLVVLYIFNYSSINDTQSIYPTDFIKNLIDQNKEQLKIKVEKEILNQYENIEATYNPFSHTDVYNFHGKSEVLALIREAVPDIDDLNITPYESDLDIPTFLRKKVSSARNKLLEGRNEISGSE